MPLAIDIAVEHDGWTRVGDLEGLVGRAAQSALDTSGTHVREGTELSVLLCDDATIRGLNRDWRGKDKATNVLSFPADAAARDFTLGDIVVAFETAQAEAEAEARPLDAYLTHLVVHGLFHLLGYDHETEAEAEAMERLESRSLARLGVASPYDQPEMKDSRARP